MNEKGNQINKLLLKTEKLLLDKNMKNMKRILAKRAGSSAWSERSADRGCLSPSETERSRVQISPGPPIPEYNTFIYGKMRRQLK